MTKVTSEIHQVGGGTLTAPGDAAIYLINFGGEAALVDAGCGQKTNQLFRNIAACGVDPGHIQCLLITHCHFDHTGGIESVKEVTSCKVVAHEEDARFLELGDETVTAAKWYGSKLAPVSVDVKLKAAREEIYLADRVIEAIHAPGHSPGSVVYLTESEDQRVLFGQDVHGPLDPSLLSNRDDYRKSLNLLLSLKADILCEGHYGIFRGRKAVSDFIRSFL
ncbi:MAG: MBL fold metallo-hydrolase [Desulfobacterales bacterium]|nr:MBL fold metallo-hydrolase [Desulfobacterales bacterium]